MSSCFSSRSSRRDAPDDDDDAQEAREQTPLDAPAPSDEDDDTKPMGPHLDKQAEQEDEFLGSLQMSGFPKDEAERRQAWM